MLFRTNYPAHGHPILLSALLLIFRVLLLLYCPGLDMVDSVSDSVADFKISINLFGRWGFGERLGETRAIILKNQAMLTECGSTFYFLARFFQRNTITGY